MKNARHIVSVMRPTRATGSLGEQQGQPSTVCANWPCSINTLSGKEQEVARQTAPDVQFAVEGVGNPQWTDMEECYLTGGSLKDRVLNVAFVDDRNLNGVNLRLLCGENK